MHTQPPAALRRPGNHTHTFVRRAGPGDPTSGGKAGSGPLPPGFRLCPGAPRGERFPLPAAPTRSGVGWGGTSCHPPGTRSPPALHTPASRPACASTAWPAVLHHQALTRRGEHLQKWSEADLASLCFSYCACGVFFFFFQTHKSKVCGNLVLGKSVGIIFPNSICSLYGSRFGNSHSISSFSATTPPATVSCDLGALTLRLALWGTTKHTRGRQ